MIKMALQQNNGFCSFLFKWFNQMLLSSLGLTRINTTENWTRTDVNDKHQRTHRTRTDLIVKHWRTLIQKNPICDTHEYFSVSTLFPQGHANEAKDTSRHNINPWLEKDKTHLHALSSTAFIWAQDLQIFLVRRRIQD